MKTTSKMRMTSKMKTTSLRWRYTAWAYTILVSLVLIMTLFFYKWTKISWKRSLIWNECWEPQISIQFFSNLIPRQLLINHLQLDRGDPNSPNEFRGHLNILRDFLDWFSDNFNRFWDYLNRFEGVSTFQMIVWGSLFGIHDKTP